MKIISLGDINKKLLFIVVGSVCKIVTELILFFFTDDIIINKHPFMLGINSGFGMSMVFIPLLVLKYKSRKKNLNQEKILISNPSFQENIEKNSRTKLKKMIIIFLCCLLDYTQKILSYSYSQYIINNLWIFDIAFLAAFSLCILHLKLYSHQLVSSLIMLIFGIVLNLINFEYDVTLIYKLLLSFFIGACYNLAIVLAKYGMDSLFMNPFEITCYEGIFALIVNIISISISTNVEIIDPSLPIKLAKSCTYKGKTYVDNFWAYIDSITPIEIVIFIIQMFSRTLFNLFQHIIAKDFTPSHCIFILIIGEIVLLFKKGFKAREIVDLFIIAIEIFMLLVFTEIIELNFCKLQKNTRKNIRQREQLLIELDQMSDDSGDIGGGVLLKNNEDDDNDERLPNPDEDDKIN